MGALSVRFASSRRGVLASFFRNERISLANNETEFWISLGRNYGRSSALQTEFSPRTLTSSIL